jgi:hypothetical protein
MTDCMLSNRATRILQVLSLLLVAAMLLIPARVLGEKAGEKTAHLEGIAPGK